jgi:hypothetical protein
MLPTKPYKGCGLSGSLLSTINNTNPAIASLPYANKCMLTLMHVCRHGKRCVKLSSGATM